MYICQICKKAPATIHLTDIHNNVKKEVHICESCAAEKGFNLQGAANLPQLLGLAAKKSAPAPVSANPGPFKPKGTEVEVRCRHCGITWSQFSDRGRLGCAHDYEAFDAHLSPLIANQISAKSQPDQPLHVGKKPGPRKARDEFTQVIRTLEKNLRQAVAEEDYESAAKLKTELDEARRKQAESAAP